MQEGPEATEGAKATDVAKMIGSEKASRDEMYWVKIR